MSNLKEPHDINAEKEILQSCFQTQQNKLGTEESIKFVISNCNPHLFTHPHYQKIYVALVETVKDTGVGNVTWADIRENIHEESSARQTLRDLTTASPATVNEKRFYKLLGKLEETYKARAMGDLMESAKHKVMSGQGSSAYDMLMDGMFTIGQDSASNGGKYISEYADDIITQIDERRNNDGIVGIRTGLKPIDEGLKGLQQKHYVFIGARPGMMKSMSLGQMAMTIASEGNRVLLATPEMGTEDYVMRIASGMAGLDLDKYNSGLYTEFEAEKLKDAVNILRERKVIINEGGDQTPTDVRQDIIRFQPDVVMIDYLQLLQADNPTSNEYKDVTSISKALNGMKKQFKIPIVAALQLSRAVESRENKRPVMSDLRSSGQLEQDCDSVYFLYRPVAYAEVDEVGGYWNGDEQVNPYELEWVAGKNRHGPKQDYMTYVGERDMVIRNE